MDEPTHHAPAPTAGASTTTEETMAVIAAEEPHGVTAGQVARALGLGVDGALVQDEIGGPGGARPPRSTRVGLWGHLYPHRNRCDRDGHLTDLREPPHSSAISRSAGTIASW
jgi:hypothetical protein